MRSDFTLKFRKFVSQFFMRGQRFTQFYERAHNENAHLHGLFAVQHIRRHDGAVFGEGEGQIASASMQT